MKNKATQTGNTQNTQINTYINKLKQNKKQQRKQINKTPKHNNTNK